MTARAVLLREIQRYYVDRENVTPSHYGMGMDSRGEYVLYADHEAERNRLLDEIERLGAMVPRWVPVAQKIVLDIQGWLPLDDQKCGQSERLWLMVPPIPLPELKGGE